jgi:hypothetical protein
MGKRGPAIRTWSQRNGACAKTTGDKSKVKKNSVEDEIIVPSKDR